MTREFENMLYLFGCGATGKEPLTEHCVSIKKIREISIQQNIWPVVYCALRGKIESGEVKIPEEIYRSLEISFEANIAKTIQKNEFNKNVISKLAENGIECCLFKGLSLARLYAVPETRTSADVDILIDPKDEEKTARILKTLGYKVEKRVANDHHMSAVHPIGGEIEVHVRIMRKNWDDIIFSDKIVYKEKHIFLEGNIKTLGVYDGLINTVTHFIKHFVRSGAGVKHIMDMLLYMKHYENQINQAEFDALMEELNYKKLIDAAKTLGVKYWGFSFGDFTLTNDEVMEKFLSDMEIGGVFGGNDEKRLETYAKFTQRRKKMSEKEYKKFSLSKMDKTFLQKIFPDKEYMKNVCGVKKCYGIFLATAHIKRWFSIIYKIISGKRELSVYMYGESKETSEQVNERIELFEKLGIIE